MKVRLSIISFLVNFVVFRFMECAPTTNSFHHAFSSPQDFHGTFEIQISGVNSCIACDSQKNVGRIMQNEAEVVKIVSSVNVADVHVVDTAKMSFSEQLTLIRNTNILIGIHGAGLMFIMFAAEEVHMIIR